MWLPTQRPQIEDNKLIAIAGHEAAIVLGLNFAIEQCLGLRQDRAATAAGAENLRIFRSVQRNREGTAPRRSQSSLIHV